MDISMGTMATDLANYVLRDDKDKAKKLEVTKYNLLVTGFNVSTVLLVASVAAALLFNSLASVTFLAVGLLMRWKMEEELNTYTTDIPDKEKSIRQRFIDSVLSPGEKEENIFKRVGQSYQKGWKTYAHRIFKDEVWKNQIKV